MSTPPTKPIESYPVADRGDLPLPPAPEGAGPAGAASGAAPATPAPAPVAVAALTFLDPAAISAEVTLQFPFLLDGQEVRVIPVRRLSGAEVGQTADRYGAQVELFDFYAAMTGYPKAVLRGLIDDDLEAVMERARPFLCRFARDVFSQPIGETGAPSPDAPAAPSASPGPAS